MPQIEEVIQLLKENGKQVFCFLVAIWFKLSILFITVFDYHVCKRIVEILKNTDKDSKNIFGQYTSKRLLDWQEIVKLYESNNVFLGKNIEHNPMGRFKRPVCNG